MVKEIALFYAPRYQRYCLNSEDSMQYKPRRTQEFVTLKAALDYIVREDGKRNTILSLDERCSQEIPENKYEIRPDPENETEKLYLKGTKIVIK